MSEKDEEEVQHKGHEIVEGDEKHPGGAKKRHSGFGKNYGQGAGYGGYSVEQDQARSQTGTAALSRSRAAASRPREA